MPSLSEQLLNPLDSLISSFELEVDPELEEGKSLKLSGLEILVTFLLEHLL